MVKAIVFLAEGFEEIETTTIIDVLRRAEVDVIVVGLIPNLVEGVHGIKIVPDLYIDDLGENDFDAIIVPGGNPGYKNLRNDKRVLKKIKEGFNSKKIVAAICAAPAVLSDAGILVGKESTIYPGMENELIKGKANPKQEMVVEDGNIITSRSPGTALLFALKVAEKLVGKQIAEAVRKKTMAGVC